MNVVVMCLGIKAARHFALFDLSLLESKYSMSYFVVGSKERLNNYSHMIPPQFKVINTSWSTAEQSLFNKATLVFRFFASRKFRSCSTHWLRYFMLGNNKRKLNVRLLLRNIIGVIELTIKSLNKPLSVIFSFAKQGIIACDAITLPTSDKSLISNVLSLEMPDLVVIQSTLSELSLYNLLAVLKEMSCPSLLIVDSWDNIGTRPIIPKDVNKYLVQSPQQARLAETVYRLNSEQISVFGTPRISRIQEVAKNQGRKILRIGYLQGLPADDLELNIKNLLRILHTFLKTHSDYYDFTIIIRNYPIKADKIKEHLSLISGSLDSRVTLQSSVETLQDLFNQSHVVISEITTAGLEAACEGVRTIFIASNSDRVYLNGQRLLKSFHSLDLEPRGFNILRGVDLNEDVAKFTKVIHKYQNPDLSFFVHTDMEKTITCRLIDEIEKNSSTQL